MMQVVFITQQGQITIPKTIRDNLKIKLESKVLVSQKGDTIVVKPVIDFFSLEGSVAPKRKPEDFKSMRKAFINHLTAKTEKIHILSFDKDFDRLHPKLRTEP